MNVHPYFDFIYRAKQSPRADLAAATLAEELVTEEQVLTKTQELTEKFDATAKALDRWEWAASGCFMMMMGGATFGALQRIVKPTMYAHGISPSAVAAILIFLIFGSILALGLLNFVIQDRMEVLETTNHELGLLTPVDAATLSTQIKSMSDEMVDWQDYALGTRGNLYYFDLKIMRGLQVKLAA